MAIDEKMDSQLRKFKHYRLTKGLNTETNGKGE
jgi:hypothetical protein